MDRQPYVTFYLDTFLGREQRFLDERLTDLIEQNAAKGNPREGFLLGGEFHTTLPVNQRRTAPKQLLHAELIAEGREYITAVKLHEAERKRITQGLTSILYLCKSEQDVRDLLPDTLSNAHPRLKELPRSRPTGWCFANQPLQMHVFKESIALLEYHQSNMFF